MQEVPLMDSQRVLQRTRLPAPARVPDQLVTLQQRFLRLVQLYVGSLAQAEVLVPARKLHPIGSGWDMSQPSTTRVLTQVSATGLSGCNIYGFDAMDTGSTLSSVSIATTAFASAVASWMTSPKCT